MYKLVNQLVRRRWTSGLEGGQTADGSSTACGQLVCGQLMYSSYRKLQKNGKNKINSTKIINSQALNFRDEQQQSSCQ